MIRASISARIVRLPRSGRYVRFDGPVRIGGNIQEIETCHQLTDVKIANIFMPRKLLGSLSPLTVVDGVEEMSFELKSAKTIEALHDLISRGIIPTDKDILDDFHSIYLYFDVPILGLIASGEWRKQENADVMMPIYKINNEHWWREIGCRLSIEWTASLGHFKTLKWIRANGGSWTNNVVDYVARIGHLEMLQWIIKHGGPMTSKAADNAAMNGHLKTLKWIRANGGPWTHCAADWAAGRGHFETLKWIIENGGEMTSDAAQWAAGNGNLKMLRWIMANGGTWTHEAADRAAQYGVLHTLEWILDNGGEMTTLASEMAAKNGHLKILQYIHNNNCPWSARVYDLASKNGHLEIIQWIDELRVPHYIYIQ